MGWEQGYGHLSAAVIGKQRKGWEQAYVHLAPVVIGK